MLNQFNHIASNNSEEINDPHSFYIKHLKMLENLNVAQMGVKDKTKLFEVIKKLNLAWNAEPDNHMVWGFLITELQRYLPASNFYALRSELLEQVARSKQNEQKNILTH